jgi:hypothetical protein
MVAVVVAHLEVVAHKVLVLQAELAGVVQAQQVQLVRRELVELLTPAVEEEEEEDIQVMALADRADQE